MRHPLLLTVVLVLGVILAVVPITARVSLQSHEADGDLGALEMSATPTPTPTRAAATKAEQIQFLGLASRLPKNTYALATKSSTYGRSGKFSCRDLSNYFGITSGESIGFHTPTLYRRAWSEKQCATKPLTCQELTDCYDFENMNENNAWALRNGFKVNETTDSFKYAPYLVAARYFGLFKHEAHAHGFHGAHEHYLNGTNVESRFNHTHGDHDNHSEHSHSRQHSHQRQCKGFYPLNCQQMSDYYGMSAAHAGTAPKCVQKKFSVLACKTHPTQTCQVLSNRFGLTPNFVLIESSSTSPRFAALAEVTKSGYVPPKEAVASYENQGCDTSPQSCQDLSNKYNLWTNHRGKASKDTFRQFTLRGCTTRPQMTCSQLSDAFGFGSKKFHPNPDAHGQSSFTLGEEGYQQHVTASEDSIPTTFLMEIRSTAKYSATSLRNKAAYNIPTAYFQQWTSQGCITKPHSCKEYSNIYGISPSSTGAASKAVQRMYNLKKCATHPLLSCQELSDIYGMTSESAGFTAEFLFRQWSSQNCSTTVSSCQQLSDGYDLPSGEWARYAPKGVKAQYKALSCRSEPLPTCQALSDYYLINHAQIDPSVNPDEGVADRLILAKYSRWGCHHMYRECQDISNFFQIGTDAKGRLVANSLVPAYAKAIYRYRQCGTSPIKGIQPGATQPVPA